MKLLPILALGFFSLSASASAAYNAACPFASDSLKQIYGGKYFNAWPAGTPMWKENGRLNLPRLVQGNPRAMIDKDDDDHQLAAVMGNGVSFANVRSATRSHVEARYDSIGRLLSLSLTTKVLRTYSETFRYQWKEGVCTLKELEVSSPDLGAPGVSYDHHLCEALDGAGLLEDKSGGSDPSYVDKIGAVIQTWSSQADKPLVLFTSPTARKTVLKKYDAEGDKAANVAIARDCAFNKPKIPPTSDSGVERGSPTAEPSDGGVERGAPGFMSPAP
jgi:hypothetical protein